LRQKKAISSILFNKVNTAKEVGWRGFMDALVTYGKFYSNTITMPTAQNIYVPEKCNDRSRFAPAAWYWDWAVFMVV